MLSKKAEKLLKWMNRHPTVVKVSEIEKKCKSFDRVVLNALHQKKMIHFQFDEDYDGWDCCGVTETGKAYLRGLTRQAWKRAMELLTIGTSIAALFGVNAIAAGACKLWEIIRALLT